MPVSKPYPDWKSSDPSASMRHMAEWFVEEARATFLKDGTHQERFFIFQKDGNA